MANIKHRIIQGNVTSEADLSGLIIRRPVKEASQVGIIYLTRPALGLRKRKELGGACSQNASIKPIGGQHCWASS